MANIKKLWEAGKGWWSLEEITSLLGLKRAAAGVYCSRAAGRGELVRVRRGIYLLPGWTKIASEEEMFELAGLIQSPSYISLITALSYYGITTQMIRSVCESISAVRSARYEIKEFEFRYIRFPERYRFAFIRKGKFFIAEPEKALADALYLCSLGRYAVDLSALNFEKIDVKKLMIFLKPFPKRVKKLFEKWRKK